MPLLRRRDDRAERRAFLAGFDISTEGFNGEWGPRDEWIELHFEEWKYGREVPPRCGAQNEDSPMTALCSRPEGHKPPHRASSGHKDHMEWT